MTNLARLPDGRKMQETRQVPANACMPDIRLLHCAGVVLSPRGSERGVGEHKADFTAIEEHI
jgi:hypothetical protein